MHALPRLIGATLVAVVLVCPVVAYLATTAPNVDDRPLSNDRLTLPTEPQGVLFSNGGITARAVQVWRLGADSVADATFIDLLTATQGTSPHVIGAELRLGTCVFRLPAPTVLRDGETLRLARLQACDDASSTVGEFAVSVQGPGAVLLWAWDMPATDGAPHGGLSLSPPDTPRSRWVLRGRVQRVTGPSDTSRLALAAWLWEMPVSAVVATCSLAFLLAWMGVWLLSGIRTEGRQVLPSAFGTGAVALAMCLLWGLIVPPLQSADSIDHLLSYGEVTSDAAMPQKVEALARRTHFERIRMHRFEQVRPRDESAPYDVAWTGDVHAERMAGRSPVTAQWWRAVAPFVNADSAAVTLRRLQWIQAVLFACLMALCAVLLAWLMPAHGVWVLAGAAVMPTLAYAATMLSDWAVLIDLTLLAGVACLLTMTATAGTVAAGAVLGISLVLMSGTSISALTVLPVVGAILAARLLLGESTTRWDPFWAGLGTALPLLPLVLGSLTDTGFQRYDAEGQPGFAALLAAVNAALSSVGRSPWLLLLPVALLALANRLLAPVRASPGLRAALQSLSWWLSGAVALAALVELGWSLVSMLPTLPTLETYAFASVRDYVESVLHVVLTSARLDGFDHLTFVSLWGGFGWVDAVLPQGLLQMVNLALVTGLVALWATPHAVLRHTGLVALAAGVASIAGLAAASFVMQRNLHGRYMLPAALIVTLLALAPAGAALRDTGRSWLRWAVGVGLALLHGSSLYVVAVRYFG